MKFSIVIPAHNEEDNIAEVIRRIESEIRLEHELIVVNDHSMDNTKKIVKDLIGEYPNLRLVDNLNEPGFASAIKTGLCNIQTEVVVPVMGDLCDDLKTIPEMLNQIEQGYDIVCASRYIEGGARLGGSKAKGLFSRFVGRSLAYLLGMPTHDIANAFKMYRKRVIDAIEIKAKSFEISMEIPLKGYYLGFKITEVPTVWHERTKGKSSFKMFKLGPSYLKLYLWAIFKRIIR
jgi:dolichol-phosphate mannosyltransferase